MATTESVEKGEDYYHVRYRDPDQFDTIRTPDWAETVATAVVDGAQVRTGDEHGDEAWTVQSVLIPIDSVDDDGAAAEMAQRIVEKMAS